MIDLSAIRLEMTEEIDQLEFEINHLWKLFRETNFFDDKENFRYAHYGYMMNMMSRVDLLAQLWKGRRGGNTGDMVAFLDAYVQPGKHDASVVAVKMWRHVLMHTSAARFLEDQRTGNIYTWQLYFGPY